MQHLDFYHIMQLQLMGATDNCVQYLGIQENLRTSWLEQLMRMGFEPMHAENNRLGVHRLHHSATSPHLTPLLSIHIELLKQNTIISVGTTLVFWLLHSGMRLPVAHQSGDTDETDIKAGIKGSRRMIKASRWEESSFLTSYTDSDEDLSALTSWSMDDGVEGQTEGE